MRIDGLYSNSHNPAIVSSSLYWNHLSGSDGSNMGLCCPHQPVAQLHICHSKHNDFFPKAHSNHIQIIYSVHYGLSVVSLAHTDFSLMLSGFLVMDSGSKCTRVLSYSYNWMIHLSLCDAADFSSWLCSLIYYLLHTVAQLLTHSLSSIVYPLLSFLCCFWENCWFRSALLCNQRTMLRLF